MDAYVIIGAPATRKSTLIRCLTGCYNRNIRDILLTNGEHIQVFAVTNSLQATHVTSEEFMKESGRTNCRAVLFGLWPKAHPVNPIKYPDALTYLNDLMIDGWKVKKVVVLDDTDDQVYSQFDVMRVAKATRMPVNESAKLVREFFNWY